MEKYVDLGLPEIYQQQCELPFKVKEAAVYYLEPLTVPTVFYDASGGPFNTVPVSCWVVLTDENGITGQAPCSPIMKNTILPWVLTGETLTYNELYRKCYWAVRNYGFSGETANELGRLDLALHDMMAKRAGLPLHTFLGAKRDNVKAYASACGTNLTLDETVAELEGFLDQGYDVFKIKVAGNFGADLAFSKEKIKVARETIGPKCQLAIDVNQIWDAEQAMRFYDMVAQYDLAWYEEPVHSHDFTELRKLTKMCPIPIGMGESVKNYYMLEEYVYCNVGQLQPIPTNLCAVRDWLRARKLAYDKGIQFTAGGVSQLTASYAASGREEDMVEYLTPIMQPLNDYMKRHPEEKNGRFYLDNEPGAGFEPDLDLMRNKGIIAQVAYMKAEK